eukprot:TRINITY_DN18667_c0_g1_i1.p2 TRINITY_DN18667_c0_g1~~TRINITY_DN18667_c0_g1_i1.p2  ORF type:complete len:102 (-),score=6.87 TRINITY_DN18667_c0_g1_i1:163-468(-)
MLACCIDVFGFFSVFIVFPSLCVSLTHEHSYHGLFLVLLQSGALLERVRLVAHAIACQNLARFRAIGAFGPLRVDDRPVPFCKANRCPSVGGKVWSRLCLR